MILDTPSLVGLTLMLVAAAGLWAVAALVSAREPRLWAVAASAMALGVLDYGYLSQLAQVVAAGGLVLGGLTLRGVELPSREDAALWSAGVLGLATFANWLHQPAITELVLGAALLVTGGLLGRLPGDQRTPVRVAGALLLLVGGAAMLFGVLADRPPLSPPPGLPGPDGAGGLAGLVVLAEALGALGLLFVGVADRLRLSAAESTRADRLAATLEATIHHRDRFLSVLSHELRDPMATLATMTRLAADTREELDLHDWKGGAVMLDQAMQRTMRLMDTLLTWGQTLRADVPMVYSYCDLASVIDSVFDTLAAQAADKGVALEQGLDGLLAYGNFYQIEIVLRNLVGNGIKFTERGGTVAVNGDSRDGWVYLHVQDTGVGIPSNILAQIEAGKPVEGAAGTAGERGSGLGLWICRELMTHMGGRIRVESPAGSGGGTTVHLRLPGPKKLCPDSNAGTGGHRKA